MKKFLSIVVFLAAISCTKEEKKSPAFCWECTVVSEEDPGNGMAGNQTTEKNEYCNLTEAQASKINGTKTIQEERFGQLYTITQKTNCRKK